MLSKDEPPREAAADAAPPPDGLFDPERFFGPDADPERFTVQPGEIKVVGRALTDAEHAEAQRKLQRGVPFDEVVTEYAVKLLEERVEAGEFDDLFEAEAPPPEAAAAALKRSDV